GVAFNFEVTKYQVETELPSFVNIMFQVQDSEGQGVNFLTTDHFEVKEDGQSVSPTESAMNIRKRETIPYTLKTVLMLDTSESVRDNLDDIKNAAITLVQNLTSQQEVALYEFSEETILLQDFTDDVGVLTRAIEGIRLGYGSTRLYGSIIDGCARWEDIYTVNKVQQGFLIILTDGKDERGFETVRQAISARGNKNIYTIGLGAEIEPEVLDRLGNAGSFTLSDVNNLADQFIEIQNEMALFADSFYRLNYRSPKRGDRVRTLELSVKNNQNYSTVRGEFNSKCFFSTRNPIVVVNPSCSNNRGIDELKIREGDAVQLQAATYLRTAPPQYSWTSSDNRIVVVIPDVDDPAMALATAVGHSGQTATLTVFDRANGLNKQVKVEVWKERTNSFTLPGGASLEMVWIEPGTFQMGSPDSELGRYSDEGPVHDVTISQGFYLGKYEVTQGQWESVMGTRPWQGIGGYPSDPNYP
ncbi:MAG: VWA domain-containing protein, partial [Gemmatimonadetes bacterium]|nr:VWA domain-containing protein [Gemmatimonadota bacterium]